jgi:DNA-repair protein XRCC4
MLIENANYFLEQLEESLETYLEKTRQAFSGKNTDIQFFLQDDIFIWKQQNILTRGKIILHLFSNVLIMSDTLKQLLEFYQKCQEQIIALEKENKCLNETNNKLITDIEKMIEIKNNMEKDLYGKFLLLLNTKKKKIRELQEIVDKNKEVIKSVYDETTDDQSEESNVESKKICDTKSPNTKKRKMNYKSQQKTVPKNNWYNFGNSSSSDDASPKPSTSKDKQTLCSTDARHMLQSKQLLDTPEEESEEDLFSQ